MTDAETAADWAKQHNVAEARFVHGKVCSLCGWEHGLRIFKNMGARPIRWHNGQPSHKRYRIVCGDPTACLERRTSKPKPKPESAPEPKPTITGLAPWGPPRPKGKTKIEKDLEKPDMRPVCPDHGPKNVHEYHGEMRFVCCGRVHGVAPKRIGAAY